MRFCTTCLLLVLMEYYLILMDFQFGCLTLNHSCYILISYESVIILLGLLELGFNKLSWHSFLCCFCLWVVLFVVVKLSLLTKRWLSGLRVVLSRVPWFVSVEPNWTVKHVPQTELNCLFVRCSVFKFWTELNMQNPTYAIHWGWEPKYTS
jgi:hypothetical protein